MADSQKYTSPVPTDYQEVEYIQSSGNGECIDTGYIPTVNTRFNIDFQFIESINPYYESIPIMGVRQGYKRFVLWIDKTSFKEAINFGTYDSGYDTSDITNANVRNVTSSIRANMYYNGIFVRGDDTAEFTTGDFSIYLFALNESGVLASRNCVVKLYGYKLYENDVLVRDFVPVYRKSDNVAGLYDTINDVFYTNQGTGSFTVGSNISPWQHSLRKLGTETETIQSGDTIYANGQPISTYSIKGNTTQSGTPTPSNPVDVNGVGVRTENLLDMEAATDSAYINSLGEITYNDAWSISDYISVESLTTYTISRITDQASTAACHAFYDANKSLISTIQAEISTQTFETPTNAKYIRCSWRSATIQQVMLNTGSTALPYEPYGYKIPISSGGVTTNIYLGSTQTVRQIKKLVFDGTENWESRPNYNYADRFLLQKSGFTYAYIAGYSSHFEVNTILENRYPLMTYNNGEQIVINYTQKGTTTLTQFKQWLQDEYANGTPLTVWYVLATPQTGAVNEPLMKIGTYADTLSNAASIPTTEGANSITVDTTVQPSEFTATWTGWHDASVKEWDGSQWNE